ncbi:MAG: LCP family protein [Nocardioidaceae bacterium]|nr:MAG: LCP family protein [Nocardioidaceae bacterium]
MAAYRGKHRDAKPRKRRVARTIAITMAVVLLAVATAGYALYRHLDANIDHFDISAIPDRPEEVDTGPKKPVNILLLGSDTREGQKDVLGNTPGLSDTTILLHLSADRKRAYGVSVPRDLMVERPDCKSKDGTSTVPGGWDQWNAAYSYGGPVCTIAQFEKMTDIKVNHAVVVDFNGFVSMVNALGGIEICVPKEINDDIGKIYLPAGTYNMTGKQSLDYVRVRHTVPDMGDVGRMKRQQAFLAAMTNKAISAGTLLNPVKLYNFLDAVTKSVTTDEELGSLTSMMGLANQFKDIGLSKIKFLTMPITTYEPDPNRLAVGQGADELWKALRHDKVLTKEQMSGAVKASNPSGKPGGKNQSEEDKRAAEIYNLCT